MEIVMERTVAKILFRTEHHQLSDPQTGIVMNSSIKSNISMTINEQGMTIPMTVVGNTTVEVK